MISKMEIWSIKDIMQYHKYFILTKVTSQSYTYQDIIQTKEFISYVISPSLDNLSYYLTIAKSGQATHGLYHFLPRWMYPWLQSECGGQWLCSHSWNQAIGLGTLHHKTTLGNPGGRGGSIKKTIINKNKNTKLIAKLRFVTRLIISIQYNWIPEYKNDPSPIFGQIELNMGNCCLFMGPSWV